MPDPKNSPTGPGAGPTPSTPPEGGPAGAGGTLSTRVLVPMLRLERDRRAVSELHDVHGVPLERCRQMVEAFARCNHFEAWHLLLDGVVGAGVKPWWAQDFLKKHGYWPDPLRCAECDDVIDARSGCAYDDTDDGLKFWHHGCAPW